jgi:rare lipoprotein A
VNRLGLFSFALLTFFFLWFAGCAAKKPVADHRQPPPAPPSTEATSGSAKRNTDASSPTVARPKRSKIPSAPAPVGYTEQGNASWYGNPFHGRHASNGEVYDMYKLTAAHRTLPFETMVRVTNLNNGKTTTVRIIDRGPFVESRIIDLSLAAAREIEAVGPGVVPIRLEVLGNVNPNAGFFTVQIGAFRGRGNAERLRDRLSASYSPIYIQQFSAADAIYYRLRVGKISGEDAAHALGEQLRAKEGFTPFVVRLDEIPSAGATP